MPGGDLVVGEALFQLESEGLPHLVREGVDGLAKGIHLIRRHWRGRLEIKRGSPRPSAQGRGHIPRDLEQPRPRTNRLLRPATGGGEEDLLRHVVRIHARVPPAKVRPHRPGMLRIELPGWFHGLGFAEGVRTPRMSHEGGEKFNKNWTGSGEEVVDGDGSIGFSEGRNTLAREVDGVQGVPAGLGLAIDLKHAFAEVDDPIV